MYTRVGKCWAEVEEVVVGRRGISIGKQTAVGSLARKMNKIMKEGKFSRVDGAGEKKKEYRRGALSVVWQQGDETCWKNEHTSHRGCSMYDFRARCTRGINRRRGNFRLFSASFSRVPRVFPIVVTALVQDTPSPFNFSLKCILTPNRDIPNREIIFNEKRVFRYCLRTRYIRCLHSMCLYMYTIRPVCWAQSPLRLISTKKSHF